jgi:NitT/TauT family transport system substrate-binding protein
MQRRAFAALGLMALLAACSRQEGQPPPAGVTKLKLATDWRAEAELGGYYQALATGEYKKRGLDVTLIQGGPAVNVPQLLATGAVDVGVGSNSFIVMNLAKENAPVKAVAAFMQKDPQVLIAHPDQGINSSPT